MSSRHQWRVLPSKILLKFIHRTLSESMCSISPNKMLTLAYKWWHLNKMNSRSETLEPLWMLSSYFWFLRQTFDPFNSSLTVSSPSIHLKINELGGVSRKVKLIRIRKKRWLMRLMVINRLIDKIAPRKIRGKWKLWPH